MSDFPDFDLGRTPLPCGTMLLEAGAGTGKTYAITGIVARLIAVEDIPIREILVVTFTEAATHELRDRVRRRLTAVALALEGEHEMDPVAVSINESGVPLVDAKKRLAVAIASFDEASIFTIHGFCQRVLRDNAFESGSAFETEVISDSRGLLLDLAMDFWRKHFYKASKLSAALAEHNKQFPDTFALLLSRLGRHPDLRILPEGVAAFEVAAANAEATYHSALERWSESREEVMEVLLDSLKKKRISRSQSKGIPEYKIPEYRDILDHAVKEDVPIAELIGILQKLSQDSIDKMVLRNQEPPQHRFFADCRLFSDTVAPWVAAFRHSWLEFAAVEFPKVKDSRRVMTFDDMLTRVRDALQGPHGDNLANVVGSHYSAALIDEFQDTDPLQYEIFTRIFNDPEHRLMFIGDPKQSIYGFRGADLFTYLKAKQTVCQQSDPLIYTLRQNYRSEAGLVAAINALFSVSPGCFLHEGVDFFPSEARSTEAEKTRFSGPPDRMPMPLQIVGLTAQGLSKSEATPRICDHVTQEIAQLIGGDYRLGDDEVRPGDIAVLVRDRDQAAKIQHRLQRARIPSVRHTDESVFSTAGADDLLCVFAAVLEPTRERLLKAALATSFFGLDAGGLFQLQSDEEAWDAKIEQFIKLRRNWEEHGFMNAFRQLVVTEHLRLRLVSHQGGERALTNLLHLAELVHDAERDLRLTPAGLIQWIHHQRDELTTTPESHFLRLERDDNSVQIVTLHKAKGLQYGIVFCPFHWAESSARETIFHNPDDNNRLNLDLSKSPRPEHEALADREVLAEEVRLLYVGVTRAIHRCYLYWCDPKKPAVSPLGRVLGVGDTAQNGPVSSLEALNRLVAGDQKNIGLWDLAPIGSPPGAVAQSDDAQPDLNCRTFDRRFLRESMVASFSGLTASPASTANEPRDHDEAEGFSSYIKTKPAVPDYSIFALPRGVAAGNALHSILEEVDFSQPDDLDELVESALRAEALDPGFAPVVAKQLRQLFIHPLGADDLTAQLSNVSRSNRLSEVEFFYPVRRFSPADLARAYRQLNIPRLPEQIDRLRFNPVDGFMLGFIDLIFRHQGRYFIADWKSNWLGNTSADYAPGRLAAAMVESSYHLQSHLYAVALDLHLASRLPDYSFSRHFGGIFYIFLRGLDSEMPENGVHFEATDQAFLEALKQRILP